MNPLDQGYNFDFHRKFSHTQWLAVAKIKWFITVITVIIALLSILLCWFLLLGAQMWWENSSKLVIGMYYILCELFTNIITIDPIYSSHSCHNCHNGIYGYKCQNGKYPFSWCTAYHPQTDRQTECIKRIICTYSVAKVELIQIHPTSRDKVWQLRVIQPLINN